MAGDNPWNGDQLYSSDRQDWGTPQALFDAVNAEFGFTLDAAATERDAKCERFISPEEDALTVCWRDRLPEGDAAHQSAIWLNPPYGRAIGKWVQKAYWESQRGPCVVVLTFVRSDTAWWHDWAMKAAQIRLIQGRVTFAGAKSGAPAPSCLLVFDERRRVPQFSAQELPRR